MIDNTRPKVLPDAYKGLELRYSTLTNDSSIPLGSYSDDRDSRLIVSSLDEATIVTSHIKNSYKHKILLDIDMPAFLVPSTTPGHHHLMINKVMEWSRYVDLLNALARAEVVEQGYVDSSLERGYTAVRLPWIKKA